MKELVLFKVVVLCLFVWCSVAGLLGSWFFCIYFSLLSSWVASLKFLLSCLVLFYLSILAPHMWVRAILNPVDSGLIQQISVYNFIQVIVQKFQITSARFFVHYLMSSVYFSLHLICQSLVVYYAYIANFYHFSSVCEAVSPVYISLVGLRLYNFPFNTLIYLLKCVSLHYMYYHTLQVSSDAYVSLIKHVN